MIFLVSIVKSVILGLLVALGVGFFTLVERKVLSYMQLRKGPNKVGIMGLPQPLADAAKLFIKENCHINLSSKSLYMMSPIFAMSIMLSLWSLYISIYNLSFFSLGIMFFLCVSSLNVYAILISGWSSNSKYALLGAIRAVAQTISYEVSMALVVMMLVMMVLSFDMWDVVMSQKFILFAVTLFPVLIMWLISSLAETNRAPFDLAEGESELVSGFNIEYGGGEFAFLFIAEYGSILFMSMLTSCMFMGGQMMFVFPLSMIYVLVISYLFLWVRASYPRMRYDSLMSLTWKTFLTVTLVSLLLIVPVMGVW